MLVKLVNIINMIKNKRNQMVDKVTNISLGNICFKLIRIKSIVENEVGNKF